MLELLFCSLLTILPDYLYRRYAQGKRIGKEITLYSVWFELRWGIIACLMLTVGLITVIFYNHPSTSSATLFYRTVPILPETNGRVAEVYIDGVTGEVKQGAPIFRLDSSKQEAAAETARRKIAETDAAMVVARTDILAAEGKIQEARSAHQQAVDELDDQAGALSAQPGHRRGPRDREAEDRRGGAPGRDRRGHRREGGRRGAARQPPAGPEGQRRGRAERRPRWIWRRPSSGPAWTGGWSSSRCGWATSSTRSCVRPEC